MKREGDRVIVDLSEDEYLSLLLEIGYAAGSKHANGNIEGFRASLALANAVNRGNYNWTPYDVEEFSTGTSGTFQTDENGAK